MELARKDRYQLVDHIVELERLLTILISDYRADLKMLGGAVASSIEDAEKYLTSATCNSPKV